MTAGIVAACTPPQSQSVADTAADSAAHQAHEAYVQAINSNIV